MSNETKSDTTSKPKTFVKALQSTADRETAQGFRGVEVDSTDNKAYTVAGVTAGMPTPETDVEAAKTVRQETGVGLSALEAADREKVKRGEK